MRIVEEVWCKCLGSVVSGVKELLKKFFGSIMEVFGKYQKVVKEVSKKLPVIIKEMIQVLMKF